MVAIEERLHLLLQVAQVALALGGRHAAAARALAQAALEAAIQETTAIKCKDLKSK